MIIETKITIMTKPVVTIIVVEIIRRDGEGTSRCTTRAKTEH